MTERAELVALADHISAHLKHATSPVLWSKDMELIITALRRLAALDQKLDALDPLDMLLDAARYAEGNGGKDSNPEWAKAARAAVAKARLAATDHGGADAGVRGAMLDAGWKYIRDHHGDLYGVGWDRVQKKLEAALSKPAPVDDLDWPEGITPATLYLVKRFAVALAKKLRIAEEKYGYSDDWSRYNWESECRDHLYQHLAKGDPRDVAAYCAFMWHHGWITSKPAPVDATEDDPSADERWQAGLDFAMIQLCTVMGVDPHDVTWDAATEETEGDVRAIIWNILRAKMGEDWKPAPVDANASAEARLRGAIHRLTSILASCEDDFNRCPQCDYQDDNAIRESNLFLLLKDELESLSPDPHASDCDKQGQSGLNTFAEMVKAAADTAASDCDKQGER